MQYLTDGYDEKIMYGTYLRRTLYDGISRPAIIIGALVPNRHIFMDIGESGMIKDLLI